MVLLKNPSKKSWLRLALCLCVSVVILSLSSCSEVVSDIGLEQVPDIQQRKGPTGTVDQPAVLDPFKRYDLVMAANECRFLTITVPSQWYWKVFLTVANREENRRGRLDAEFLQVNPPWSSVPASAFSKSFDLGREGVQAVLGVGNTGPDRPALLRLCQQGAPLLVTIESQVSAAVTLLGPDLKVNGFNPE